MQLRKRMAVMVVGLFAMTLLVQSSTAAPINGAQNSTVVPKFTDPVFGVPFLESSTIFQGQQAVLGFEIGCRQNMISPNIHEFSINGSVVNVTVNVGLTQQCFMPTRIFRYAFGADLAPGVYEVRLFARYSGLVFPKGQLPLQVLAAEPVPTLRSHVLLALMTGMLLIGLWAVRIRF
jgi:hypothetical protein